MQASGVASSANVGGDDIVVTAPGDSDRRGHKKSTSQSGAQGLLGPLAEQSAGPAKTKPHEKSCLRRMSLSHVATQFRKLGGVIPCCSAESDSDIELDPIGAEVAELRRRLVEAGESFRTTPEERASFVAVFKQYHAEVGEKTYNEYRAKIETIKADHPELAHIPTDDLIALRGWTSGDYILVQDALDTPKPDQIVDPLPYLKAIISAYHALPESYIYTGTVYTGEFQTGDWVNQRYTAGKTRVDWRIFATSETEAAKWQGLNVNWETQSHRGKRIALFSERPEELEVMFVPPTWHKNNLLQVKPETANMAHPDIDIRQEEVSSMKRREFARAA